MRKFISSLPKLSVLLVCLPIVVVLQLMGLEGTPLFIVSAAGILGTVTLIGKATEEVAIYSGPLWGGLLNATFGNVTELIITLFALTKGPELHLMVLGSLVGSILGNLLLVLGGAMIYGGAKYTVQKFSRTGAHVNVGMLWVVLIMLMVPSLVQITTQLNPQPSKADVPAGPKGSGVPKTIESPPPAGEPGHSAGSDESVTFPLSPEVTDTLVHQASIAAAIILLIIYGLSLLFSLRTHRYLLRPDPHHEKADWSKATAIGVLVGATLVVAYLSHAFVESIEHLRAEGALAMSEMFLGVIVVAVVGNAAEGMVAVWVAREDKMELSFQIAMGSCLQVGLLVAPVLVIASYFMGSLMPLTFDPFMLMSLTGATLIASAALNDGESNWLEGSLFLAVYVFFALVFWFHPS